VSRVAVHAMRRADVPDVVRMMRALIEHIQAHGEPAPGRITAAKVLKNGFGRDRWFGVFVATVDGRPAGYALHHRGYEVDDAARVLYLSDLYVAPEARRLGAARTLMAAMAKECQRVGALEVLWRVHSGNRGARAFYGSLGAKEWRLGTTMWWPKEAIRRAATSRTRASGKR
jgi:GNAT superfamily N-acetyltransferase